MRAHLILGAVAAALLAGCSTPGAVGSPPDDPATPPATSPADAAAGAPIVASWAPGASAVDLPDGWRLTDCDGDVPALCLERDGDEAGLLALSSYPLTDDLAAGEDDTSLAAALRAFADSRNDAIAQDRAAGCGADYRFAADKTVVVRVGNAPGVRYGFTGTEAGATTEHVVTYATVHAGQLWLIVAEAASSDGCMASDELLVFEPDVLADLLPTLDRVVAGTPLPAAGSRIEDGTVVGVDGGLNGGLLYVVAGGHKERIQQPRAMTREDVTAEGLVWGTAISRVKLETATTGSTFVIVPPDGSEARLHLVVVGTIRPVAIQMVDAAALDGMQEAPRRMQDRLRPAG